MLKHNFEQTNPTEWFFASLYLKIDLKTKLAM